MRWRCPRFRSKKQLSCHCCLSHWESNKYEKCYASTMHLVGSECVFLSPLSMLKFAYASAVAISLWVTDATVYIKCVYPRLGLHQDKLRILCRSARSTHCWYNCEICQATDDFLVWKVCLVASLLKSVNIWQKSQARAWLSHALGAPGQHTDKRWRKCTRQSRSCL